MPKLEYIVEVTEKEDGVLREIALAMGFDYDVAVLNLIKILIESEVDRYNHENN